MGRKGKMIKSGTEDTNFLKQLITIIEEIIFWFDCKRKRTRLFHIITQLKRLRLLFIKFLILEVIELLFTLVYRFLRYQGCIWRVVFDT